MFESIMGGGIGGGLLEAAGNLWQNEINSDEATWARDHSAWQAGISRDWQERMSNTAYQRGTADMKAAGLNPMLAYSQGGASTPGGAMGQSPMAHAMRSPTSVNATTASQIRNMDADTAKKRAETDEVTARTPTHPQNIAESQARVRGIEQNIKHSIAEIDKIVQETKTSAFSAENIQQQTRNLKEVIPQIQETVRLIRAQTGETTAGEFLKSAQSREVHQRLHENLPRLEANLKKLEVIYRQMEMPGKETRHAFESSATGAVLQTIRETLKDILPGFGVILQNKPRSVEHTHRRAP